MKRITRKDISLATKTKLEMDARLNEFGLSMQMTPLVNCLPVTHCSQNKAVTSKQKATPENFYVSNRNLRFYQKCKLLNLRYGILSDMYGLHLDNAKLKGYDIHPSELTDERLWECGDKIKQVCEENNITSLHYVYTAPTHTVPYLLMLFASGVPFTIHSNNVSLEQVKQTDINF